MNSVLDGVINKINVMNIEQEIWNDFKCLSDSKVSERLSYSSANAHFGVVYEDRNQLIHNGINKKLEHDEDYKINKFLLESDYKNINWDDLKKLYPSWQRIELPKIISISYPVAKFRTHKERREIGDILLNDWEIKKQKLHLKIPNETAAKDYLIDIRWDDCPVCPRCESKSISTISHTVNFMCRKCRLHFSERVGTIFQNSKLELIKWYEAMYLLTSLKTSKISTHQLADTIGVTQKTSWGMVSKIKSKVKDEFIEKIKTDLFK